jgi:rubrerythrin
MVSEQDNTIKALQISLQMEIDGKEFYLKASQQSRNRLGQKLLRALAAEEDIHQKKFEEIYDAIRSKKDWPVVDFRPDGGKGLRTVFAQASEEIGSGVKVLASELEAVKMAQDMEGRTRDFYRSQSKEATHATQRDFYEALSGEEQEHLLVLLDYYEYLKDPSGWFVNKEHPTLDGS